jgi:hypothetical protein
MIRQEDAFAERAAAKCKAVLHEAAPSLWTVETAGELANGIRSARGNGVELELSHIIHNSRTETTERLDCVCLVLERGASRLFLPSEDQDLLEGDRLLFAGRETARREMLWALCSPDALLAFATGQHLASGAVGRWIHSKAKLRK